MYHHKREKDSPKFVSTEDILREIPDGEFIAIFGTSHTHGCCEKNNREVTHIDTEFTWADIVSRELKVPYVNFAIPGNNNRVIIQQIIDFLDLPDVSSRCKMILCEVRFGDIAGRYFFDLFADKYKSEEIPRKPFLAGKYTAHWLDRVSGAFVPKSNEGYAESLVRNSNPAFENYVPQEAITDMKNIITTYIKSGLSSSELVVNDLLDIRVMRKLSEGANIPFKFFFWDHNKISHSSEYFKQIADLFDEMYNLDRSNIKNLMPNVNTKGYQEFGEKKWRAAECECGHKDHTVHAWVAKQIIEELKNDFCS